MLTPLWQTLATTTGASTTRYLHGSTGLARQQDTAGVWTWAVQDALGSIRSMVSSANAPLDIRQYAPYGEPTQLGGAPATVYGFTGEPTDASGLVYLRARYMRPGIAAFLSLDPVVEGNRYGYANANPVMWTDPSGRKIQITEPVKLKKKVTVQRVQRSNGLPAPSDKQGKSGGNKRIIPQMQPEVEVCDPNNRVGPCWEFANQIYQQYGISIGVENGMTSYSGISWRLDELRYIKQALDQIAAALDPNNPANGVAIFRKRVVGDDGLKIIKTVSNYPAQTPNPNLILFDSDSVEHSMSRIRKGELGFVADEEWIRGAVIHEIGHVIEQSGRLAQSFMNYVGSSCRDVRHGVFCDRRVGGYDPGTQRGVTEYGEQNPREDFAESWRIFVQGGYNTTQTSVGGDYGGNTILYKNTQAVKASSRFQYMSRLARSWSHPEGDYIGPDWGKVGSGYLS